MELDISFGKNRSDTNWKPDFPNWDEFVKQLSKYRRTTETMAEYDAMQKADQGNTKDGAAFVGGLVKGGRRKKENIQTRSLLTLDVDYAGEDFFFDVDLVVGGRAHVIYSTHSHRAERPKYRLIVPTDRAMSPDEYGAVSRKLAEQIGMEQFDHTTFQVHRLMYLPSCSKDATPVFEAFDGYLLSVDLLLAEYTDWKDPLSWPKHPKDTSGPVLTGKKAQDPREKEGMIGLFCRAYGIEEGIAEFLGDVYERGSKDDRYTYMVGNSGNGLQVFTEQDLAYSHQDSDPVANGRTHNLFDLVRIHKFGRLDDDINKFTPENKTPSYTAMRHFVAEQDEVKVLRHTETSARIEDEFGDMEVEVIKDDKGWVKKLDRNKEGNAIPTPFNLHLIFEKDARFKGLLALNEFTKLMTVTRQPTWRKSYQGVSWSDDDDSHVRDILGLNYKLQFPDRLYYDTVRVLGCQNSFHPIREYLNGLSWDGVPRVDDLLIKLFKSPNTPYTRAVTRCTLVGAVARVFDPGCKHDEMLVTVGPTGIGKSTLFKKLCGEEFFNDGLSCKDMDTKAGSEKLEGYWILEVAELAGMKKAEEETVKGFLSRHNDIYRPAYGRQMVSQSRQCIFVGSTNQEMGFLRDPTGGRRFWPVRVYRNALDDIYDSLDRDQIWAEATNMYMQGEPHKLSKEMEIMASKIQDEHMEDNGWRGMIERYLEKGSMHSLGDHGNYDGPRNQVCALEIWVNALRHSRESYNSYKGRAICGILKRIDGWEHGGQKATIDFGKQTVFTRIDAG